MTSVDLVSVMAMVVVASVVAAMVKPGNESFVAKWANVLRDHRSGFIVRPLEDWYFTRAQPEKGGEPKGLNEIPGVALPTIPSTPDTTVAPKVKRRNQTRTRGRPFDAVPSGR